MAITFFGVSSTPADDGTEAGPIASVVPPASMLAGDLVVVFTQRRDNTWPLAVDLNYEAGWGGQRWSISPSTDPEATGTPALVSARVFWCRFNGTWTADPSFRTSNGADDSASTLALTLVMLVFRPTAGTKFWVPCVWPTSAAFVAGTTPFTKTITAITTATQHGSNSHVAIAMWASGDDNTWGSLAGTNWVQTSLAAQYRNLSGSDQSMALAYQIQTASGTTNNVSLNQATLGGDAGATFIMAFTEIDLPSGGTGGTRAFVQSEIFGDNGGGTSAAVTLPAPVTSGNSVVGHFNFESHISGGPTIPQFPITDDQGNELVVIQCFDYRLYSQTGITWFRPNITNASDTFTVSFGAGSPIATGATAHEINGGVELEGYSADWGHPGYRVWTPLSAGSVTTGAASYIYAIAFWPGESLDPPKVDYTAWSGTKREEIGNDSPAQQIICSGDINQGAAGAINVTDSESADAFATTLMMVALRSAAGAGGRATKNTRGYTLGVNVGMGHRMPV